jgi:hypothetical protein
MDAPVYDIRLATMEDVDKIRQSIRYTLTNPEGRPQRKRYEDAVQRGELLVLTHYDPRERTTHIDGFIEWHTKVDGSITIRDAGSAGDEVNPGIIKRLLRELLRLTNPPRATVKVNADQPVWNSIFAETPGFILEGQEYSRPHWRNIWVYAPELVPPREREQRPAGRARPRRR